jgi:hypothetical protein
MPFTLMHISDLHRLATDPIGNPELLSTLIADRERAAREDPAIAAPDAIIVTGDLVQGARLGQAGHESELDAQYEVARDLLDRLAEEFLGGDRARLVMLPGNHDVDWNCARAAMELVPDEELGASFSLSMCGPGDDLRWSWRERRAYRIVNRQLYEQRLARFDALTDSFYAGVDIIRSPFFRMHPLRDDQIVVVAFSSCVGNDCYAGHGAIDEDALAGAHLDLQGTPYVLRVAAWHHGIDGEPSASDYMSVSTVHRMIGKGFRLGLHGHQHHAAAANRYVYLPEEERMAVVSAGSLCAGASGLPVGVNRQYNLIEIADDLQSARIHVREMAVATNFAPARRPDMGFSTFAELSWALPAGSGQRRAEHEQRLILDAERAIAEQRYGDAEQTLERVTRPLVGYARSLMVVALSEQAAWDRLAEELAEPQSIEELVLGVGALLRSRAHEQAERYLEANRERLEFPEANVLELEGRIAAARGLS